MKVLGIDPSSALSACALVNKSKLEQTAIWTKDSKASHPWNLYNFFRTTISWCGIYDPDLACIESLSVARGAQVTRMIAFYQAAAVIGCKEAGIPVIEARVTTARRIALGDGSLSKEEAFKEIKQMFPKFKFRRIDAGGLDESDATVLGLAGPDVAEQ